MPTVGAEVDRDGGRWRRAPIANQRGEKFSLRRVARARYAERTNREERMQDHAGVALERRFDAAFQAEFAELLAWRRDVRRFRAGAVPEATLENLFRLAAFAPSVGNVDILLRRQNDGHGRSHLAPGRMTLQAFTMTRGGSPASGRRVDVLVYME